MKSVKYSSKLVMSLTHKFKTLFEDMSQDKKNRILGGVSFFMWISVEECKYFSSICLAYLGKKKKILRIFQIL